MIIGEEKYNQEIVNEVFKVKVLYCYIRILRN